MAVAALPDTLIDELVAICGDDHVFTGRSALFNRARVPSPFPKHRWAELHPAGGRPAHLGGADLRGREAGRTAHGVPGRPPGRGHRAHRRRRAAQARDPRRREADEPDPRDRRRGPHGHRPAGDQHAEALPGAAAARLHLSGQPGVVPVLARRRAHRHERLVADRRPLRPHARSRDQLRDRAPDRRDHPGRRRRRAEDAQVVLGVPAQAPLHGPPGDARDRHRGDARAGQAPRGRVLGLLRLPLLRGRLEGDGRVRPLGRRDPRRRRPLRRVEGRATYAATTRRTFRSPTGCRPSSPWPCTETTTR